MADFQDRIKGKSITPGTEYPAFFIFEEECEWIEGKVSDPRVIETQFGDQKVVTITTPEGSRHSLSLSQNLSTIFNMDGKYVIVKYLGKRRIPGTKKSIKEFEIYT